MALLVNLVAFQLGWFSAVISAAASAPWFGALVISGVVALHLKRAGRPQSELALLAVCGVAGGVWDSFLVSMGWVAYPSGMFAAGIAPYWIIMMWLLFATTLNASMSWLHGRPLLAAACGMLGGPLSYIAGQKLGGIILVDSGAALIALAIGWAVMMPALLRIAERFNGVSDAPIKVTLATE